MDSVGLVSRARRVWTRWVETVEPHTVAIEGPRGLFGTVVGMRRECGWGVDYTVVGTAEIETHVGLRLVKGDGGGGVGPGPTVANGDPTVESEEGSGTTTSSASLGLCSLLQSEDGFWDVTEDKVSLGFGFGSGPGESVPKEEERAAGVGPYGTTRNLGGP